MSWALRIACAANFGVVMLKNVSAPESLSLMICESTGNPLHYLNSVSTSVGGVLKPAGLEKSVGIISSNYGKDPTDPQWHNDADYKAWLEWMNKYYPDGDKTSSFNAYAYSVAYSVVEVLKRAGDNLTRANIMKAASSLKGVKVPMLYDGVTMDTSATDFAPLECERLIKFNGEKWEIISPVICPANN